MKYRVKKGHTIHYPDGSIRGMRGYIIDGSRSYERPTIEDFADDLERVERQAVVSPVDVDRLWQLPEVVEEETPEPKVTKKKATKKKAKKAPKKILDKILGKDDDGGEA